jgi:dihydroorotase
LSFKKAAAGVFTGGFLLNYLAEIFGREGKLDMLPNFVNKFGAEFLEFPVLDGPKMRIRKCPTQVPEVFGEDILGVLDGVVPFRAGEMLQYSVEEIVPEDSTVDSNS